MGCVAKLSLINKNMLLKYDELILMKCLVTLKSGKHLLESQCNLQVHVIDINIWTLAALFCFCFFGIGD